MHKVNIRKVGGSQMIAIPKPILDRFQMAAGDQVEIDLNGQQIVITPSPKEQTLDELISRCDLSASADWSEEDRAFVEAPLVGAEIIE